MPGYEHHGEAGRVSVRSGPSPLDLLTGAHAAYGIMVALRHLDRTGEGQMIDLSLYETAIHLISNYMGDYTGGGPAPSKNGPYFAFLAPYGVFQARDREFYLGVESRSYAPFCEAIARPDLAEDPRFRTNPDRLRNRDALHAELFPIFASRDAAEWMALAEALGIPASLVNDVPEVMEQAQAKAREMVVDCGVDGVRVAGIPLKLSLTPGAVRRPPPELGADNDRVLGALAKA